jgi:hypothetical protein
MPVFAIEARGLDEASMPDTSVEDMARHCLARFRKVQVEGPYFLLEKAQSRRKNCVSDYVGYAYSRKILVIFSFT